MRNLLILGAMFMGLTFVGCGDEEDDTAVEEEVDTSVDDDDSGEDADAEEAE